MQYKQFIENIEACNNLAAVMSRNIATGGDSGAMDRRQARARSSTGFMLFYLACLPGFHMASPAGGRPHLMAPPVPPTPNLQSAIGDRHPHPPNNGGVGG